MPDNDKSRISQYNLRGKEIEAFLGPLESSIIGVIWNSERKPVRVREVYEKLKKKKNIAYTTVMSTMDRLYDKSLLDRRLEKGKGGLFYVYWPRLEEQNFKKSAVREVINSLVENFGEIVTSYLIEEATSDEQELKALKEQVENIAKEKQK
ncbi:MAG: BlaI/MecI/CopY family transcriptional regulator [Candidatus Bathyarchaeia archaeon]|jgi:predicted transcriptional regulator